MTNIDVIRSWKDEAYRMSLSETERSQLEENPAGVIQLDIAQIAGVAGGARGYSEYVTCTIIFEACCCSGDICKDPL
jgi:mersacidin/lichenicidin family type 2 lantibiotic